MKDTSKKDKLAIITYARKEYVNRQDDFACNALANGIEKVIGVKFCNNTNLAIIPFIPEFKQFYPPKPIPYVWWDEEDRKPRLIFFKHLKRAVQQGKSYKVKTYFRELNSEGFKFRVPRGIMKLLGVNACW